MQVERLEMVLDAVLMGQLFAPREVDDTFVDIRFDEDELLGDDDTYYEAYNVARDPFATTEFVRVRDTSQDHIATAKFPLLEAAQPMVPYEKIEIAERLASVSAQFTAYANALPIPTYSAPFERVDLEALAVPTPVWPEATEIVQAPSRSRTIETIVALACALAFGMAVVYFVLTR